MNHSGMRLPIPYCFIRKPTNAFTVTELLVSVGLISVLATLLWVGSRSVRQAANTAKCGNHLRQCGSAMLAYAGEHRGILPLYVYRTAGSSVEWLRYLTGRVDDEHNRIDNANKRKEVYLSDATAAVCPGFAPFTYPSQGSNRIYGTAARNAEDPASVYPPGTSSSSRLVYLSRIQQPSRYWLLADSYHPGHQAQIYVISPNLASEWGIHFRHGGKASVLFADGHVEVMTPSETSRLPVNAFSAGYDEKLQRISTL